MEVCIVHLYLFINNQSFRLPPKLFTCSNIGNSPKKIVSQSFSIIVNKNGVCACV